MHEHQKCNDFFFVIIHLQTTLMIRKFPWFINFLDQIQNEGKYGFDMKKKDKGRWKSINVLIEAEFEILTEIFRTILSWNLDQFWEILLIIFQHFCFFNSWNFYNLKKKSLKFRKSLKNLRQSLKSEKKDWMCKILRIWKKKFWLLFYDNHVKIVGPVNHGLKGHWSN